jgi:UDP-N-acetylmuramate--alanine ligase
LNEYNNIYFVGIGGIGMSALARYFNRIGKQVAGYDRTQTELCHELENEGIAIHYADDVTMIPIELQNPATTLVVYTPAVPKDHTELNYFRDNGFRVIKRSEALGEITKVAKTIAVAGTHGKTTTSSMVAHILKVANIDITAFLGGITLNYNSNLILPESTNLSDSIMVTEADEYDRSFLTLHPYIAIITSNDADHLDIYGDKENMHKSYIDFAKQIVPNGTLIVKNDLVFEQRGRGYFIDDLIKNTNIITYSISDEKADYRASQLRIENGFFVYDIITPQGVIDNIHLGLPGTHNVENSVAACAAASLAGANFTSIKQALQSFKGAKRRFEYILRTPQIVYIDDYAHHPSELEASIKSVRMLYPDKKITGIFQPHLFTRTRDFAEGFAQSLDLLDEAILLDIYPARELPLEGVTSTMLLGLMKSNNKRLSTKQHLVAELEKENNEVVVTLGAGDIDTLVEPIKQMLTKKYGVNA